MKKTLLFGLIIALMAGCGTPKDFDYRDVKNIKVEGMGTDKTTLCLDLVFYNPNGYGAVLKKIDCDMYVNNNYLGKFLLDTTMRIERRSEFTLPARIQVDIKAVLKNGLSLLFNQEVLINVKGSTRVGRSGFYKTVPFNYEAKHTLSLF